MPVPDDWLAVLQKLRDNKQTLPILEKQMQPSSTGIIPFVGAGLSIPFGFPAWRTFLHDLAADDGLEDVIEQCLAMNDYEQAAQELLNARGLFAFNRAITSTYGAAHLRDKSFVGTAAAWVPLIARGPVITTNFDRVLEGAFGHHHASIREIWGARHTSVVQALNSNEPIILKLHGDADDPLDRVLTREDYERAYGTTTPETGGINPKLPLPTLLTHLLVSRPLLFLGCSLIHDRTILVLEQVATRFRSTHHFAIVELPENIDQQRARARFLSEHHIHPIWYPHDCHDWVEPLLAHLYKQMRKVDDSSVQDPRDTETGSLLSMGPPFDLDRLPLPAHFIGRTKETAWLRKWLTGRRPTLGIAAINGLGGIGKTALVAHAIQELHEAGHFRDGIVVIPCTEERTIEDAQRILVEVLTRFDPQRRGPEAQGSEELTQAIIRKFSGLDVLVVLDNIEPELPIAQVVSPLRAAGVRVLLTARQMQSPDVIPRDARLTLDLLSPNQALTLFAKALGYRRVAQFNDTDRLAAAHIVQLLDRHTLALTLAGAYVRDVGRDLEALAEELEDPQRVLRLPNGEAPGELKRVFMPSYEALPAEAQLLFTILAALPAAEFGRAAALALAEAFDIAEPLDTLDLLVRRALVTPEIRTGTDLRTRQRIRAGKLLPANERLRLHPLIRAMAGAILDSRSRDLRLYALQAAARYYAAYTNETVDEALDLDEANIIGALAWADSTGDDTLVASLVYGIRNYWRDHSRILYALDWLPRGIASATRIRQRSATTVHRLHLAQMQLTYGQVLQNVGRLAEAEQIYQQTLQEHQALQNSWGEGIILACLGQIAQLRGQLHDAAQYYSQALTIEEPQNLQSKGVNLAGLGQIAQLRGELEQAEHYYSKALAISRERQDSRSEGMILVNLGQISRRRGELEQAEHYYSKALAISRERQYRIQEGVVLDCLADIAAMRGDTDEAEHLYRASLEMASAANDEIGIADSYAKLGKFLVEESTKRNEGCAFLEKAATHYAAIGLPDADIIRAAAQRLGCFHD